MKKDKQMIYTIAGVFIILFAVLIGDFVYFTVAKQKTISVHIQNKRLNTLEDEVVRGTIYDSGLEVLAENEGERRTYPYGSLYAHAIGYMQNGKIGMEAFANKQLLYPTYTLKSLFKNAFMGEKFEGRDVVTTLDHDYQQAIADAMQGKKGAAVIIEASTGKIKAMYSNPAFDPNYIVENWDTLNNDTAETPLINRATKGLYPPGSIFKVITTLAYKAKYGDVDFTHDCTGYVSGAEYTIKCFNGNVHGTLNLAEAFAKSCNTYFISLVQQKLGVSDLKSMAEKLGFNQALDYDMDYSVSRFSLSQQDSDYEKAATAIGQGKTLTTPLHMAILASAIINDGIEMKPYMLDYAMDKNRNVKYQTMPEQSSKLLEEETAQEMQLLMEGVIDTGTAKNISFSKMHVGGKTGTAENETAADHSWFMGFAKDSTGSKEPIGFAVIIEGGGQGAQSLQVVQSIINAYGSGR